MTRVLMLTFLASILSTHAHAQAVPCAGKTGDQIAACVNAAYPEKRVPTSTLVERRANATFLRDRLIETARCAGLDVGRNCKRGNCSDISADFVAWKTQGRTQGVDVIGSWDDLKRTISVGWNDSYGPPTYGSPTYQDYGPVYCAADPIPPQPQPPAPPTDLSLILSRLDALESNTADIRNHLADLRGILAREEAARMNGDLALREDVNKIPTVPTRCIVRVFGVSASCRME